MTYLHWRRVVDRHNRCAGLFFRLQHADEFSKRGFGKRHYRLLRLPALSMRLRRRSIRDGGYATRFLIVSEKILLLPTMVNTLSGVMIVVPNNPISLTVPCELRKTRDRGHFADLPRRKATGATGRAAKDRVGGLQQRVIAARLVLQQPATWVLRARTAHVPESPFDPSKSSR